MLTLDRAAWAFAADPADRGRTEQWQAGLFRGAPVTLPHVSDTRMTKAAYAGSVSWYRTILTAPRAAAGASWELRFEQVRRVADVWIDGRHVGRNGDSYRPFVVPARALGDGRPHTIVVRADNRVPRGQRPDGWWNWGGITRSVTLAERGSLALRDTGTMPQRTCPARGACSWTVLVDATIANDGGRTLTPTVRGALAAPSGEAAGSASVRTRPLAPGERARVRFRVPVTGTPQLWSPADPRRYRALVTAEAPGAAGPAPVTRTDVGLRSVRVLDGVLYLNGRPVELRGASIHEDAPGRGPALTGRDIDAIVSHLKAVGANVTRAHYALDQRLLDRFDSEGILVWAQAPVYHRDDELDGAAGRAQMLDRVRSAVLQTRSHPSVLTHSVANELSTRPDQRPGTAAFLRDADALTRDLDPTLPVAVDLLSYPGTPRQQAYARFELLGLNTYFGWYPGPSGHSTADLKSLVPFVRQMRRSYPGSALVMTEFGAEATTDGPATRKQTYAFQERYIDETLDLAEQLPQLSGAIYWTLQEFAVKPDWNGGAQENPALRDAIHHKGVITRDGRRKPAWQALRDQFTKVPFVRSSREVELATGIPQPSATRGRLGAGITLVLIAGVLALLVVDLLALLAWRRHTHPDEDELMLAALTVPQPAPLSVVEGGGEHAAGERVA